MSSSADQSVSFRALRREDLALLGEWLEAPHVARWWREPGDPASLEERFGPGLDGEDPTQFLIVERAGEPVGFAQRYRFSDEPEWRETLAATGVPTDAAGIDYLIGSPRDIGAGLGPHLLESLVTDTFAAYPEVGWIVVDVDQGNRRSWRALEKAGFERRWAGFLESADPADTGPVFVYTRARHGD